MGLFSQTTTPRVPPRAATSPSVALFYQEHFDGVLASVRFFGVPERDALDVAQDVFVRVCASLPRYDPSRPHGVWLTTIAYRTAQDYLRSAHSRRTRLAPTEHDMEVIDTASSPEQRTLLAEMQQAFIEVLQELNEDQRTVYLMSVKDEIPIPEIAEALGLPENTVRSRLFRARKAVDAAVARRRTAEERRQSALAPMLVPAMLADAARKGFEIDPAVKAVVWSQLSRVLGLGIIGALAPLPGAAIVGGAALLVAMGGGAGALLHAVLEKPTPTETVVHAEVVHAETEGRPRGTASPVAPPSASATATVSASASVVETDAGAPDPAALMRAEAAILTKAREAMAGEHYEVALRELNRHERLFPYGRLAEQRKEMKRVVQAELSQRDGGSR